MLRFFCFLMIFASFFEEAKKTFSTLPVSSINFKSKSKIDKENITPSTFFESHKEGLSSNKKRDKIEEVNDFHKKEKDVNKNSKLLKESSFIHEQNPFSSNEAKNLKLNNVNKEKSGVKQSIDDDGDKQHQIKASSKAHTIDGRKSITNKEDESNKGMLKPKPLRVPSLQPIAKPVKIVPLPSMVFPLRKKSPYRRKTGVQQEKPKKNIPPPFKTP